MSPWVFLISSPAVCWGQMGSKQQAERLGLVAAIGSPLPGIPDEHPVPSVTVAWVVGWSCGSVPPASDLLLIPLCSVCHYGRLFWEWGDGILMHDSQKPQDPNKLSKEDVLSFIQMHSA